MFDELARVLRPGGRIVAVTNFSDHLAELAEFVGAPPRSVRNFAGEDAEGLLRQRFSRVKTIDASGTVTFGDRDAVLSYVSASRALFADIGDVPALEAPLVVRRRPLILVATK